MKYKVNIKKLFALIFAACAIIIIIRGCAFALSRAPEKSGDPTGVAGKYNISVYIDDSKETVTMDLEEYLTGVVAAEMPVTFGMEALKAQAVAARTFTVRRIREFGGAGCKSSGADICTDSACCQAWSSAERLNKNWGKSYEGYIERINEAVGSTAGQIATYDGEPIEALYHSTSGGKTEFSQNVFSRPLPYLVSVNSPGEEDAPKYKAVKSFTAKEFAKKINASYSKAKLDANKLKSQVEILSRYDSGRVEKIRLGGVTISGKDLRKALTLNSTNFQLEFSAAGVDITTIGFGHGVGMSQLGANSMASGGSGYIEIITHYYTGTKVESIDDVF